MKGINVSDLFNKYNIFSIIDVETTRYCVITCNTSFALLKRVRIHFFKSTKSEYLSDTKCSISAGNKSCCCYISEFTRFSRRVDSIEMIDF